MGLVSRQPGIAGFAGGLALLGFLCVYGASDAGLARAAELKKQVIGTGGGPLTTKPLKKPASKPDVKKLDPPSKPAKLQLKPTNTAPRKPAAKPKKATIKPRKAPAKQLTKPAAKKLPKPDIERVGGKPPASVKPVKADSRNTIKHLDPAGRLSTTAPDPIESRGAGSGAERSTRLKKKLIAPEIKELALQPGDRQALKENVGKPLVPALEPRSLRGGETDGLSGDDVVERNKLGPKKIATGRDLVGDKLLNKGDFGKGGVLEGGAGCADGAGECGNAPMAAGSGTDRGDSPQSEVPDEGPAATGSLGLLGSEDSTLSDASTSTDVLLGSQNCLEGGGGGGECGSVGGPRGSWASGSGSAASDDEAESDSGSGGESGYGGSFSSGGTGSSAGADSNDENGSSDGTDSGSGTVAGGGSGTGSGSDDNAGTSGSSASGSGDSAGTNGSDGEESGASNTASSDQSCLEGDGGGGTGGPCASGGGSRGDDGDDGSASEVSDASGASDQEGYTPVGADEEGSGSCEGENCEGLGPGEGAGDGTVRMAGEQESEGGPLQGSVNTSPGDGTVRMANEKQVGGELVHGEGVLQRPGNGTLRLPEGEDDNGGTPQVGGGSGGGPVGDPGVVTENVQSTGQLQSQEIQVDGKELNVDADALEGVSDQAVQ